MSERVLKQKPPNFEGELTKFQENMLIFTVMLGCFISVLNFTNINIALPDLMTHFDTDMATVQWIVVGYMLAQGIIMPTVGYYMDKFSGRWLFLIGLVLFAIASAFCAVAPTIELMVIARLAQGLAGGLLGPVPGTLVYQFLPRERQLMAISLVSMVSSFGVAVGPSLAGVLVQYLDWHAIFWANVPLSLLTLVLTIKYIPYKAFSTEQKLDVIGLVSATVATIALLFGFNQGSNLGWTSPITVALLASGAVCFAYFVYHEVRAEQPMLNFAIFRYAGFTYSMALNTVFSIATCIGPMFLALLLQNAMGMDSLHAGLALFTPSLLMAFMAPVAAKAAEKFSRRVVIAFGMAVLCFATWQMSLFGIATTLLGFTLWVSLRYTGLGLLNPLVNNFAMTAVPTRLTSHASAMLSWTRQLITTIAISMFSLMYSNHITGYMQQGVSAELGADLQARVVEAMAISDVNFASLIVLFVSVPLIYFLKDKLLEVKDEA